MHLCSPCMKQELVLDTNRYTADRCGPVRICIESAQLQQQGGNVGHFMHKIALTGRPGRAFFHEVLFHWKVLTWQNCHFWQ